MVIKLIDRLHNMQTMRFLEPAKQKLIAKETVDIYVKIADRLSMFDLAQELEALCLEILEPEIFKKLTDLRHENEKLSADIAKSMRQHLDFLAPDEMVDIKITPERKRWSSLRQLIQNDGPIVTGLHTISVALICPNIDSCYLVLGKLHQLWKRETLSFQDFINSPQINGYRGIHTTIILNNGTRVRCKIRTEDMHSYAHAGITVSCFDSEGKGILEYLSWAQRITPLSRETKDRSKEFWDSLQSDILGDTIVIHGSSDETADLPSGATALDGAFYLFKDLALRLTAIKVNGSDAALQRPLKHGDSLNIILAPEMTAKHEWLGWVKTSVAAAYIRSTLATKQSNAEKIIMGKSMLQRVLTERGRGLIDEFEETQMQTGLRQLDMASLEQAYINISEGRLNAFELYASLFQQKEHLPEKPRVRVIKYRADMSNLHEMDQLNTIHRKYGQRLSTISYQRQSGGPEATVTLRARMSQAESERLSDELSIAGAMQVSTHSALFHTQYTVALTALIVLWGLDPVVAHTLLSTSFDAFDLMLIRFSTVFIASLIGYTSHSAVAPHRLKPLSPLFSLLPLAGVTLFVTGFLTYHTLALISATQYILFILLGQILASTAKAALGHSLRARMLFPLIFLTAAQFVLIRIQGFSLTGVLFAVASALSFTLYSNISERYQNEHIRTRYPAYLFWVSLFAVLCALLILPLQSFDPLPTRDLLLAVGFSLLFTFFPYVMYFEMMRRMGRGTLDRLLPLTCLATFGGEILLADSFSSFFLLVMLLVAFALHAIMSQRPGIRAERAPSDDRGKTNR
jgi:drug/metabolite transporter (DMT)-like permease